MSHNQAQSADLIRTITSRQCTVVLEKCPKTECSETGGSAGQSLLGGHGWTGLGLVLSTGSFPFAWCGTAWVWQLLAQLEVLGVTVGEDFLDGH